MYSRLTLNLKLIQRPRQNLLPNSFKARSLVLRISKGGYFYFELTLLDKTRYKATISTIIQLV
jgi:hypothetical protein